MEKNNKLMSGSGEKGKWITVNGAHVFVEDGQSVEDAVQKHFNKAKSVDKDPEIEKFAQKIGMGYGDAAKMHKELQEDDEAYKTFLNNKTDEDRNDKYTDGNPDNINKPSSANDLTKDLENYKGSGRVDLVLSGGRWAQIRPQKDGSYLVRTNSGSKYVDSVESAKKELSDRFANIAPKQAKDYASGKGHLSENGGYHGVINIDNAPKFEYKNPNPYQKGEKFTNPAGVEFEVVDTSTNKHGVEYVKLRDASGEFEIEKDQLDRLGWLTKFKI